MAFQSHIINSQDHFIAGWYIDKLVCEQLVDFFESKSDIHKPGVLGVNSQVDKTLKESTDITINEFCNVKVVDEYFNQLSQVVELYKGRYRWCGDQQNAWGITSGVQIQRYLPQEGYHQWHCEIDGATNSTRHLVFMTYLNDVDEGGETHWFYQNLKLKPEKGLTVIWPPSWTHMHKGITSPTQSKYIVTGWYNYL